MIKVAIVGCGKIADSHAWAIGRIAECEIVGVCDQEPLMAKQLHQRFPVKGWYSDIHALLHDARPDVVHITTPPQSHYSLGKVCLEHGCNVYIEKPFTRNTQEAKDLIELAVRRGLKVTAGHDDQFRHAARRLRAIAKSGYLGDPPYHLESIYGYEIGTTGYAAALLGDKNHWVRALPGGLFQNIISHGLAQIAEYLADDAPRVKVIAFVSPMLAGLGEHGIVDELRVMIADRAGNTAYFTFSSHLRPCLHEFRILGPRNGLVLNLDNETVIRLSGRRRKSYLEQFVPPVVFARQYLGNALVNARSFLARDFHSKAGMKCLIESFYRSIRDDSPLPVSYREILLTASIMDSIINQLGTRREVGLQPSGDEVPG